MTNKIFGLGLSKTGTKSLARALAKLGYRTAHHAEHFQNVAALESWFRGDFEPDALANFDAAADLPIPTFFADLDQRYPGSKFILTVRDVDKWLASVRGHWERYPIEDNRSGQYRSLLRVSMYSMTEFAETHFRFVWNAHQRNIAAYFKDRPHDLLTLDICGGEGWDRLCAFLGKPTPAEPFPWANKGEVSD